MARKFANKQVKIWSKRRRLFPRLKAQVFSKVLAQDWSQEEALAFMNTPSLRLKGRTPKEMLNPILVAVLRRAINQVIADYSKL
jgi:hypothetical protein